MAKIILITGGQRSGKSSYAQKKALQLSTNPIYLATSRVWDDEHAKRINRHKLDRGDEWQNIEEEIYIGRFDFKEKVVLIDCVTLWMTNFFYDNKSDVDICLELAKVEIRKLQEQAATFIFVTNEIGLGGISDNEIMRKFTDLQGWMNQYMASLANEVYMMVSGIPLKIK